MDVAELQRDRAETAGLANVVRRRLDVALLDVGRRGDQGDHGRRVVLEVRRHDGVAGLLGVDRPPGWAAVDHHALALEADLPSRGGLPVRAARAER